MHAHHHDTTRQVAGQLAGSTASMISIIAPVVSSFGPSFSLPIALPIALSKIGRSPAVGTRRRHLQSWNLGKPGLCGAWTQVSTRDMARKDMARKTGGRLRRRIEVSPH